MRIIVSYPPANRETLIRFAPPDNDEQQVTSDGWSMHRIIHEACRIFDLDNHQGGGGGGGGSRRFYYGLCVKMTTSAGQERSVPVDFLSALEDGDECELVHLSSSAARARHEATAAGCWAKDSDNQKAFNVEETTVEQTATTSNHVPAPKGDDDETQTSSSVMDDDQKPSVRSNRATSKGGHVKKSLEPPPQLSVLHPVGTVLAVELTPGYFYEATLDYYKYKGAVYKKVPPTLDSSRPKLVLYARLKFKHAVNDRGTLRCEMLDLRCFRHFEVCDEATNCVEDPVLADFVLIPRLIGASDGEEEDCVQMKVTQRTTPSWVSKEQDPLPEPGDRVSVKWDTETYIGVVAKTRWARNPPVSTPNAECFLAFVEYAEMDQSCWSIYTGPGTNRRRQPSKESKRKESLASKARTINPKRLQPNVEMTKVAGAPATGRVVPRKRKREFDILVEEKTPDTMPVLQKKPPTPKILEQFNSSNLAQSQRHTNIKRAFPVYPVGTVLAVEYHNGFEYYDGNFYEATVTKEGKSKVELFFQHLADEKGNLRWQTLDLRHFRHFVIAGAKAGVNEGSSSRRSGAPDFFMVPRTQFVEPLKDDDGAVKVRVAVRANVSMDSNPPLVFGDQVSVLWKSDDHWYRGKVAKTHKILIQDDLHDNYCSRHNISCIKYDNGDQSWLVPNLGDSQPHPNAIEYVALPTVSKKLPQDKVNATKVNGRPSPSGDIMPIEAALGKKRKHEGGDFDCGSSTCGTRTSPWRVYKKDAKYPVSEASVPKGLHGFCAWLNVGFNDFLAHSTKDLANSFTIYRQKSGLKPLATMKSAETTMALYKRTVQMLLQSENNEDGGGKEDYKAKTDDSATITMELDKECGQHEHPDENEGDDTEETISDDATRADSYNVDYAKGGEFSTKLTSYRHSSRHVWAGKQRPSMTNTMHRGPSNAAEL